MNLERPLDSGKLIFRFIILQASQLIEARVQAQERLPPWEVGGLETRKPGLGWVPN